jgi:hypothetical protein
MTPTAEVMRETERLLLSTPLERTVSLCGRWLFMPDKTPLYGLLATVAANRLPGDPVWLLLVAPPGSLKTELLNSLLGLPNVHPAATLTEAALLSGSSAKDKAKDAKGGLLREIGDFGFLICKDFGSVLSQHPEASGAVLAALRELYDGAWTRHVGTDGGRKLHWSGKLAVIGGCTQSIDRHHRFVAGMGERFCYIRVPRIDERARRNRRSTRPDVKPRCVGSSQTL